MWFDGSRTGAFGCTVYPKKYAHGFVVLCFVVVIQSFKMNSHEVFIHIHQGCFAGTGAIVRLPQCQWSKPDGYGKISQCITTTKHSKAKTVCIFLGIYCMFFTSHPGDHVCIIVIHRCFFQIHWQITWGRGLATTLISIQLRDYMFAWTNSLLEPRGGVVEIRTSK